MIPLGSTACFNAIAQADSGLTGIMRMSEDTSRISTYGEISMDQRDWEILDKQLRGANPTRRNDDVTALTVVMVFFAGMTLGSILSAHFPATAATARPLHYP